MCSIRHKRLMHRHTTQGADGQGECGERRRMLVQDSTRTLERPSAPSVEPARFFCSLKQTARVFRVHERVRQNMSRGGSHPNNGGAGPSFCPLKQTCVRSACVGARARACRGDGSHPKRCSILETVIQLRQLHL